MFHIRTQLFTDFLRRRRQLRHFGRHPLPGLPPVHGPARLVPDAPAQALLAVARDEPAAAIARLASHADGLSDAEAAARLRRSGPNEIAHEKPLPGWLHLWHCYANPFNLLLTTLALVSFLTGDPKATAVIGAMVVLSTAIRFVQEGRSNRAAESLRSLVGNTATVIRRADGPALGATAGAMAPSVPQEVPLAAVVPGDLVALSAGDIVPADCRVLTARDLFLAEAAMTGESLPVESSSMAAPRPPGRWRSATWSSWARASSRARPRRWSWPRARAPTSAR